MKKIDRTVYRKSDGKWANQRNDKRRASSVHSTGQAIAFRRVRGILALQGVRINNRLRIAAKSE